MIESKEEVKIKTDGINQLKDMLYSSATSIQLPTGIYYYLPYWFKRMDDGYFEMIHLGGKLPPELIEHIENQRK